MKNPMYFHLDCEGGGHITSRVEVQDDTLLATFAFCSPKDQFARKKGRWITDGRFLHHHLHPKNPIHDIHKLVNDKNRKVIDQLLDLIKLWDEQQAVGYNQPLPRWWKGMNGR
jgi:hypothetical protein